MPQLADTCDNCEKHLASVHGRAAADSSFQCPQCLPNSILRSCACRVARYCSEECQKQHWPEHKLICKSTLKNYRAREAFGPVVAARHSSLHRWIKKARGLLSVPAGWLLGVGTESDISTTHVFLVYVKGTEHPSAENRLPKFSWSFDSARCVPEAEIRQMDAARFHSTDAANAATDKHLETSPGFTRIVLVDPGLPFSLDVFHALTRPLDIEFMRREPWQDANFEWDAFLRDSLQADTDPETSSLSPTLYMTRFDGELEERAKFCAWYTKYGETFGMAAHSALNLRQYPKRLVTHVLVVYTNVSDNPDRHNQTFIHRVRDAKVATLPELKSILRLDAENPFLKPLAEDTKRSLFARPNILRVVIIDERFCHPNDQRVLALDTNAFRGNALRNMYEYHADWLQWLKNKVDSP